jgi:ribose transport system ATP-binding protein
MLDLARLGNFSLYPRSKAKQVAEAYRRDLEIRCESIDQPVGTLSGGNQQKVVLAKWLRRDAQVFLFDEPTRGIDVAARELVYKVIRRLAREGKGILVVSSDLEELVGLCDRIGVMSNGRWFATFQGPRFDSLKIVDTMFAGYQNNPSNPSDLK